MSNGNLTLEDVKKNSNNAPGGKLKFLNNNGKKHIRYSTYYTKLKKLLGDTEDYIKTDLVNKIQEYRQAKKAVAIASAQGGKGESEKVEITRIKTDINTEVNKKIEKLNEATAIVGRIHVEFIKDLLKVFTYKVKQIKFSNKISGTEIKDEGATDHKKIVYIYKQKQDLLKKLVAAVNYTDEGDFVYLGSSKPAVSKLAGILEEILALSDSFTIDKRDIVNKDPKQIEQLQIRTKKALRTLEPIVKFKNELPSLIALRESIRTLNKTITGNANNGITNNPVVAAANNLAVVAKVANTLTSSPTTPIAASLPPSIRRRLNKRRAALTKQPPRAAAAAPEEEFFNALEKQPPPSAKINKPRAAASRFKVAAKVAKFEKLSPARPGGRATGAGNTR